MRKPHLYLTSVGWVCWLEMTTGAKACGSGLTPKKAYLVAVINAAQYMAHVEGLSTRGIIAALVSLWGIREQEARSVVLRGYLP